MYRKATVSLVVVLIAAPVFGAAGVTGAVDATSAVDTTGVDRTTRPGPGAGEPPQISVSAPNGNLVAGTTQPLVLRLVNDADDPSVRVSNATNVRVDVRGLDAIEDESGEVFVAPLSEGRPRTATVNLDVTDRAVPGTYDLPVEVTYEYVDNGTLVEGRTVTEVTVEVDSRPRFELRDVDSNVAVGDTGTLNLTLHNTGGADAEDVSVTLNTASPSIGFGGAGSTNRFVGEWKAGKTKTLQFDVSAAPSAESRSYTIQGTVDYETDADAPARPATLKFGVTPAAKQSFGLGGVSADLEVGERGTISGTVENTGDRRVRAAVLLLESTPPSVTPVEPQYSIGTLAPGERVEFDLDATISPTTDAGPRRVTFRVQYRSPKGETRASDPLDAEVRVEPEQTFAVEEVTADLQVGNQGTINGTVVNTGTRTIEDAVVLLQKPSPMMTPVEPEYAVGNLEPGERASFQLEALVGAEASAGPRQVTVQVRYSSDDGTTRTSDPTDLRVGVDGEQSFDLGDVESTLRVGEKGTIRGIVVNAGSTPVEDAVVTFGSLPPTLTPVEPEYAVGTLGPGESATFALEASASPGGSSGPRQVNLRVQYRTDDGTRKASDALSARVRVGAEQSFAVENVDSTLRIGSDGQVTGSLVNTGNRAVENVAVVIETTSPSLDPVEPEYAVGTLEPGQSVEFEFDVDVTESAEAGPRQLTFRAQYRSDEGEPRSSKPLDARVSVSGQRKAFSVEVVSGTVGVGASDPLEVRVTNEAGERLTDVSAKVYDSAPLSASDDEAFVDELNPGESRVLTFRVGVGSSAIEDKAYPMKLDFQYDDADGESTVSDVYRIPVTAGQQSGGSGGLLSLSPLLIVAFLVVVVLGSVGYVAYRRFR